MTEALANNTGVKALNRDLNYYDIKELLMLNTSEDMLSFLKTIRWDWEETSNGFQNISSEEYLIRKGAGITYNSRFKMLPIWIANKETMTVDQDQSLFINYADIVKYSKQGRLSSANIETEHFTMKVSGGMVSKKTSIVLIPVDPNL